MVPNDLLNKDLWEIPRAWRLQDLMDEYRPCEAFARWAAETVEMFEALWKAEEAATAVQPADRPSQAAHALLSARRASLVPLTRQGLSLRQIVAQTGLTASQVVGSILNPRCQGNAERYLDADDDIRRGALDHQTANALARRHGVTRHAITRLATIAQEGL